ncbi:MAG: aldehyde dehydrogenase family protein, partial [Pseudomonadota bacterium]|nr:aldehyde dehydrogenase family protein [Pseudomonadota bacterium]
ETAQKLAPTLVLNPSDDMVIMQEEIFGPLLPVKTYKSIDEVINYVNSKERPLALYLFSDDKALQKKVLLNTISGGVTLNDCIAHVAQHDLPFGGIGNSGMGQYHGYEGFMEFSKLRPVHSAKSSKGPLLTPPYDEAANKLYKMAIKLGL